MQDDDGKKQIDLSSVYRRRMPSRSVKNFILQKQPYYGNLRASPTLQQMQPRLSNFTPLDGLQQASFIPYEPFNTSQQSNVKSLKFIPIQVPWSRSTPNLSQNATTQYSDLRGVRGFGPGIQSPQAGIYSAPLLSPAPQRFGQNSILPQQATPTSGVASLRQIGIRQSEPQIPGLSTPPRTRYPTQTNAVPIFAQNPLQARSQKLPTVQPQESDIFRINPQASTSIAQEPSTNKARNSVGPIMTHNAIGNTDANEVPTDASSSTQFYQDPNNTLQDWKDFDISKNPDRIKGKVVLPPANKASRRLEKPVYEESTDIRQNPSDINASLYKIQSRTSKLKGTTKTIATLPPEIVSKNAQIRATCWEKIQNVSAEHVRSQLDEILRDKPKEAREKQVAAFNAQLIEMRRQRMLSSQDIAHRTKNLESRYRFLRNQFFFGNKDVGNTGILKPQDAMELLLMDKILGDLKSEQAKKTGKSQNFVSVMGVVASMQETNNIASLPPNRLVLKEHTNPVSKKSTLSFVPTGSYRYNDCTGLSMLMRDPSIFVKHCQVHEGIIGLGRNDTIKAMIREDSSQQEFIMQNINSNTKAYVNVVNGRSQLIVDNKMQITKDPITCMPSDIPDNAKTAKKLKKAAMAIGNGYVTVQCTTFNGTLDKNGTLRKNKGHDVVFSLKVKNGKVCQIAMANSNHAQDDSESFELTLPLALQLQKDDALSPEMSNSLDRLIPQERRGKGILEVEASEVSTVLNKYLTAPLDNLIKTQGSGVDGQCMMHSGFIAKAIAKHVRTHDLPESGKLTGTNLKAFENLMRLNLPKCKSIILGGLLNANCQKISCFNTIYPTMSSGCVYGMIYSYADGNLQKQTNPEATRPLIDRQIKTHLINYLSQKGVKNKSGTAIAPEDIVFSVAFGARKENGKQDIKFNLILKETEIPSEVKKDLQKRLIMSCNMFHSSRNAISQDHPYNCFASHFMTSLETKWTPGVSETKNLAITGANNSKKNAIEVVVQKKHVREYGIAKRIGTVAIISEEKKYNAANLTFVREEFTADRNALPEHNTVLQQALRSAQNSGTLKMEFGNNFTSRVTSTSNNRRFQEHDFIESVVLHSNLKNIRPSKPNKTFGTINIPNNSSASAGGTNTLGSYRNPDGSLKTQKSTPVITTSLTNPRHTSNNSIPPISSEAKTPLARNSKSRISVLALDKKQNTAISGTLLHTKQEATTSTFISEVQKKNLDILVKKMMSPPYLKETSPSSTQKKAAKAAGHNPPIIFR